MKPYRKIIFVLVSVFAILIQLAAPTLVYADGETDPPPPTEVAVEPPPPTEESATNEVPVATEVPVTGGIPAEAPVATEVPGVADTPLADPAVAEEPELLEVLEQLPADTDVVVLDENGDALPLATQEAAEIIMSGDPMWCPTGEKPGDLNCKGSRSTINELLAMDGWSIMSPGTIWISSGDILEPGPVNIDGLTYVHWEGEALTLQGGWDGIKNGLGTITTTNSVFNVPISIVNWTGAVTVNNITIDSAAGIGLRVETEGDINLSNVTASNNENDGAYLNNCHLKGWTCNGTGKVTLTGSNTFSGNKSDGLWVESTGKVNLENVTASNNGSYGAHVSNAPYGSSISNTVILQDSNFNGNGYIGLFVGSKGNITLESITASNNMSDYGAILSNSNGTADVTVTGANVFNNNRGSGLAVDSNGNITLENVTADGNSGQGIFLYQGVAGPAISISNVTTRNNCYGLFLDSSNDTAINVGNIADNMVGIRKANDTDPLVLNHVTLSGNTANIASGFVDCENQNGGGGGAVTLITSQQQQVEFILDCLHQQFYPVNLPNGDQVKIVCPVSGKARITRLDNTMLPAGLPEGYIYASAFSLEIFQGEESIFHINEGGHVEMSFRVPSVQEGNDYSILYWDNGAWVPLKDFMLDGNGQPRKFKLHPDDPREILSGLNFMLNGNSNRAETSTNFPGIFVLAQH